VWTIFPVTATLRPTPTQPRAPPLIAPNVLPGPREPLSGADEPHGIDADMRASSLRLVRPPIHVRDGKASDQKHPIERNLEPALSAEAELVRDVAP
jgi:hypothetical protein